MILLPNRRISLKQEAGTTANMQKFISKGFFLWIATEISKTLPDTTLM
jgi:hypothetical protein